MNIHFPRSEIISKGKSILVPGENYEVLLYCHSLIMGKTENFLWLFLAQTDKILYSFYACMNRSLWTRFVSGEGHLKFCSQFPPTTQIINEIFINFLAVFLPALGMGLCVAFIALVRLPSLKVSTLLLVGLLVYDVFWVSQTLIKTNKYVFLHYYSTHMAAMVHKKYPVVWSTGHNVTLLAFRMDVFVCLSRIK